MFCESAFAFAMTVYVCCIVIVFNVFCVFTCLVQIDLCCHISGVLLNVFGVNELSGWIRVC